MLGRLVVACWAAVLLAMAISVAISGLAGVGPDSEGAIWGFFAAGSLLGVIAVALLVLWSVQRLRHDPHR